MCVCVCVCVHDEYGTQTIYITVQVCTCTLCENNVTNVRNKNPKSLQVVQAQSVCVAWACLYVQMYMCGR